MRGSGKEKVSYPDAADILRQSGRPPGGPPPEELDVIKPRVRMSASAEAVFISMVSFSCAVRAAGFLLCALRRIHRDNIAASAYRLTRENHDPSSATGFRLIVIVDESLHLGASAITLCTLSFWLVFFPCIGQILCLRPLRLLLSRAALRSKATEPTPFPTILTAATRQRRPP